MPKLQRHRGLEHLDPGSHCLDTQTGIAWWYVQWALANSELHEDRHLMLFPQSWLAALGQKMTLDGLCHFLKHFYFEEGTMAHRKQKSDVFLWQKTGKSSTMAGEANTRAPVLEVHGVGVKRSWNAEPSVTFPLPQKQLRQRARR